MKDIEGLFTVAEKIAELKAKASENNNKPRRARAPRNFKHLNRLSNDNIVEMLQRHLNEADLLNKVLEDRQKATKKDEKKEEKKHKLELTHVMAVLVAGYPIIGLLMWLFMR